MSPSYTHIVVDIHDQIGVIKVCPTIVTRTVYAPCLPQQLNRPKVLNAWNETMLADMVTAFRELDQHPCTIFTVLTGEGRFFSAGADIRQGLATPPPDSTAAQKKLFYMRKFSIETELFRLMIDHRKVFVLALNGPGVGGGAAWFTGLADIVLAASGSYLQVPFNSLGLVPEFGAARTFAQSMGVRRANEFLMFGRKCTVEELEGWGLVNRGFPLEGFGGHVLDYLRGQLEVNDGGSILETKRLMNGPMRAERVVALFDAVSALAERFVEGVPAERFERRTGELKKVSEERRGKEKSSL